MFKVKMKEPKINLFKPKKATDIFEREGEVAMNRALVEMQNNIVPLVPRGVTSRLVNSIRTIVKKIAEAVIRGKVFSDLQEPYGIVQESGRRAAPVSAGGQELIARWIRLSTNGQAYFNALKQTYPKITVRQATFLLARSMKRRARKGKEFFKKGVEKSLPAVDRIFNQMFDRITKRIVEV